jgi:hypothetical protein
MTWTETDTTTPLYTQADSVRQDLGLLTEELTAEVLLLRSVDTLAAWRSNKKGPVYVKLGKRVFYTEESLRDWITASEQEQHGFVAEAA